MKILSTIHQTWTTEWRIRINPRVNPDGSKEELVRMWTTPENETMLIFNPIVSIVIRNTKDKTLPNISVPINRAYGLEDALSVVYNNLKTKGLYKSDGNKLYLDNNIAEKCSTRLNCYRDIVVFRPSVLYLPTGEDVKGIIIVTNGQIIGELRHDEIRECCEVLNHLDVQTYTLIASLLDQQQKMEGKLDRIIQNHSEVLMSLNQILKNQTAQMPEQKPDTPFTWKPLS